MRQLSMFTSAQIAGMRDRTASRNRSPGREQFRREHERHRAWGLARRHAERLRRLHPPKTCATGPAQRHRTQASSAPQTRPPERLEQPTRAVPVLNHPTGEGVSRGDSTPAAQPELAGPERATPPGVLLVRRIRRPSAKSITSRPRENPRPRVGYGRRRHGIGIGIGIGIRNVPAEPISTNRQINAIVSAMSSGRNRQLYDRTRFLISARPP
jgi:hypothetical protein